jgi:hypothetical protein
MVTLLRGFSVLLLLASAPAAYFAANDGQRNFDRDVSTMRDMAETQVIAPGRANLETSVDRGVAYVTTSLGRNF